MLDWCQLDRFQNKISVKDEIFVKIHTVPLVLRTTANPIVGKSDDQSSDAHVL